VITKIFPQITTPATEHEFTFTFGAADLAPDAPAYGSSVTFNNSTDHKLDTRIAGRYLSYKVETPTIKDFTLSGMDINIVTTGRRLLCLCQIRSTYLLGSTLGDPRQP
jgi:hypothetical protein